MTAQGIAPQDLLHLQSQRREALAHIGVASRKPHPHARRKRDHRRRGPSDRAATTAVTVAASTAPAIRIRAPVANSISIAPLLADACAGIGGPGSAITVAGTKPIWPPAASFCSARNDRRHLRSNDRETPYRRAVADTCRGACKVSSTILSYSSSDQRRRRPISTCACRKSNPDILVVQPAENWAAKNLPGPFDGTRERRILLQG
jgi:hypothetical protein